MYIQIHLFVSSCSYGWREMESVPQVFVAVQRQGGEEAELHPLADISNREIQDLKMLHTVVISYLLSYDMVYSRNMWHKHHEVSRSDL